jgi:hypothetical protein
MDICILVTLYLSNGQEKKKKEKHKQGLVYPNTLSHIYPQNLHHTYLCSKNAIPSSICAMSLHSKSYFFLLCNLKVMGN